jgi:hypothetical protein
VRFRRRALTALALASAIRLGASPPPALAAAAADSGAAVAPAPLAAAAPDSASSAAPAGTVLQRDVFDVISGLLGRRRIEPEVELKPRSGMSVNLLPTIGYNPAYGAFIGAKVAMGGWLGDPATTNLSAGSAGISWSTTGQTAVEVRTDFYAKENSLALKGDWRYLDTSQDTYGLGPAVDEATGITMDFRLYRFYQTVYLHVRDTALFAGAGYHLNRWDEISERDVPRDSLTDYRVYSGGALTRSTASGVSVNVLYDTRDNAINAKRGTYWNLSLRTYLRELGSDETWQSVLGDFRVYPNLPKGSRNTLAIWSYAWLTFGEAPYLDLPATGWDTYGRGARGWVQGHIRGGSQVYGEAEYRFALSRDGLWGGVIFLNSLWTTSPVEGQFGPADAAAGAGLRVKFNKRTSTNLAADLAFDQFGNSNVFFGLQEVF